jgi:hypothetical protein
MMGGGPATEQDLFRAEGGFNRLDEVQTLSYCPRLLRPNEPRSFPLPSYALPERTSLRHTLRTSHGTASSASAISENEIIPVVGICARTVSAVGILSSPKEESSKSSSLRPKSRIWFRQMMKWLRQSVSRHTDGNRLTAANSHALLKSLRQREAYRSCGPQVIPQREAQLSHTTWRAKRLFMS